MREIKFRAWNKNPGYMTGTVTLKQISEGFKGLNNNIIMQYTGLKDKNGIEIYFDDIIQHQNYYYTVLWNRYKLGFKMIKYTKDLTDLIDGGECITKDYGIIKDSLWNFGSCEIIGNIYENPNLLKS